MTIYKMGIIVMVAILSPLAPVFAGQSKLNLNWGNSSATVSQSLYKNGVNIEFAYVVSVEKIPAGYILRQSDIRVVSAQGQPVFDTGAANQMATAVLFPPLKIDERGDPVEVIEFDKYLAELSRAVNRPEYDQLLSNPQFQQVLYAKSIEVWCYWVCFWREPELESGLPLVEIESAEYFGVNVPSKSITRYHGIEDGSQSARYTFDSAIDGEEAKIAFAEAAASLSNGRSPNLLSEIKEIRKHDSVSALVEPVTIKPKSVEITSQIYVSDANGEQSSIEVSTFEFDWY